MPTERPDPDALLARVQAEEAQAARGRLKVFLGAAPGVGKTYAMLEAGRKLAKEGLDVVVGYVEPHVRPETQALVLGLDVLQRRAVDYKGRTIWEFDLEAALARKPALLLVDELAHTNAAGSMHAKRWQDVEQLLDAGIDVYTTLNVQHLESLNDVVAQITSVVVRETVPDTFFERADEVELVDLSPEDLIDRLHEGKIYLPEQAERAIEHFFRKGNLIALRELALRKTAERVGEQALDYRQAHDVATIWPSSERLLVCVGPSPLSARLVRAARRMAAGFRASWTALHVELEHLPPPTAESRQRLDENLRLAEALGGTIATAVGSNFAQTVLEFAHEHNVTKVVVGKPQRSRWWERLRGAFVYDLIRDCGEIDIYVISGDEETATPRRHPSTIAHTSRLPYVWSALAVAACTGLCYALSEFLAPTNLAMIYLTCVVIVSLVWGRGPSALASVISVVAFDVFFIPPFGTLAVSDTQYLFTFGVMLATGLLISELTARVRAQAESARNRERTTAALYDLSRELSALGARDAVAHTACRLIQAALGVDAWIVVPADDGKLIVAGDATPSPTPSKDEGVVKWVYEHRQPAGFGTQTLPGSDGLYLPLLVSDGNVGVIGIRPRNTTEPFDASKVRLLEAFAGQVAVALERCNLAVRAEQIRLQMETERMRNSLLSAVSHDLRTPLATITGAASLLVEGSDQLPAAARRDLAESVLGEAERLNRLVINLLDLTRLEAGALQLKRDLQPIDEVVGVVLGRMMRELREFKVDVRLPNDLPPVPIDGLLIQQVLMNLLDNAAKFSTPGGVIELSASQAGNNLVVTVTDQGPGVPEGKQERIFEKFYRVDAQSRTGSGIGLAICRGIITLHGGTIQAENQPSGGAVFRFTLPIDPLGGA